MQSKRSRWLMILLAIPALACQSVFDSVFTVDNESQKPQQQAASADWPQARFVTAQEAVSPAGSAQLFTEATLKSIRAAAFSPLAPLPGQPYEEISTTKPTPVPLPQQVIKIDQNQLAQIDSFHLSNQNLQTIQIFVNGQPLVATEEIKAEAVLPGNLLELGACTQYQWFNTGQDYVRVCSRENVVKTNQVDPSDPYPAQHQRLSLIVEGRQVGTYNLRLVTTDAGGSSQEITYTIEVVE